MEEIDFNDAQQVYGFITPQQLRIEAKVYQMVYPAFDYAAVIPVNTDGDMWDIGSIFYTGDVAGKAEFLASKGFDMPFADISQSSAISLNYLAGIGYEWSLGELKRAAKLKSDLKADKASAAKRIAEGFIYFNALQGSAEKNQKGLINQTVVPTVTAPADGTASATAWDQKTPEKVLRDFNAGLELVINNSKETLSPDTVLLPSTVLQYMNRTLIGTAGDTLLKFVLENNSYTLQTGKKLTIKGLRQLEAAGGSGSKRAIFYAKDRDVVQFHLPGPHEFLDPFRKSSMTWEVAGIMNIGGVEVRLPKGIAYMDGI